MTAASAQTQTVKGRVVDENNAPVIGATVVVRETARQSALRPMSRENSHFKESRKEGGGNSKSLM